MSEEILKALMQLFAIIVKQGEGVDAKEVAYVESFLRQQLNEEVVEEFMAIFHAKAKEEANKKKKREAKDKERAKPKVKDIDVRDMVRVLAICRRINKTLNQKQKVVVLARLFELLNADRKFSKQRMEIINIVAEVFNISKEEFESIQNFVVKNEVDELDDSSIMIINDTEGVETKCKRIKSEAIDGSVLILRILSTELYFLRYTGSKDLFLNGLTIHNNRIYLFAVGSTLKLPKGKPIYYSDVVSNFMSDKSFTQLSFNVNNVTFRFPGGTIGLHDISFSETHGKLIGIMGASGAGKTTLLNLLSGINAPSEGEVLINGFNLHKDKEELEGVIGYIPQDDLLIEELTVFENLYYNAKLCFRDKSDDEIVDLVEVTLKNLGLYERKDLTVGTPMNKLISGGQRKRLNIALELIREPSILFVDEPTSGLSSRDSENVMDLLSELTLKGKLIFVVIHQPSSDIYKMFDKMIILDTGGYLIYYGNPVQAIVYFKELDNQINSEVGECTTCGNVTPELIFNIVEAQVVDEFGQYTGKRKVNPIKWEEYFRENVLVESLDDVKDNPPQSLSIPKWFSQFKIFTIRDVLAKLSNKQYIILNLLEAPLLGFILAFIIRYIADPKSSVYIYYDNENIPPYIFMSIVVALFLGLTVSAEEIFKDRKILKREKFLNLSRSSYLASKVLILTTISAIQALLFVLVGNFILGIEGMYFEYWMVLFSTFVFANMMGLNISASFNSAVTIYILIPLLMIPQMALGGAMFSFDKLNRAIGAVGKVPVIAEIMVSRWSYEALMVNQFKNNRYEKNYYDIEKRKSIADFKQVHYIPALKDKIDENLEILADEMNDSLELIVKDNLTLLNNELRKEARKVTEIPFENTDLLTLKTFDEESAEAIREHIEELDSYYNEIYYRADTEREAIINYLNDTLPGFYLSQRRKYHNEHLQEIVTKYYERNKILEYDNHLVQQVDPIFLDPDNDKPLGFRTHFYAPTKFLMGRFYETFWFNVFIIWLMSILLYIPLYYEHLKKFLDFFGGLNFSKFFSRFKKKKKKEEKELKKEESKKKN